MSQGQFLGIVNISEDSFSDGGLYLEKNSAIQKSVQLHLEGADYIDLGPASSHPDAQNIAAVTEIERLKPVLEYLQKQHSQIKISIDSFQSETQRFALQKNVSMLNDIHGFADPSLYDELSQSSCKLVIMHAIQSQGLATRETSSLESMIDRISVFFEKRLNILYKAGIKQDRCILDPGMGFFLGNDPHISMHVLKNIKTLQKRFTEPFLVGVSRKSFLQKLADAPLGSHQLTAANISAELFALKSGVQYIRSHDVAAIKQAWNLWNLLTNDV